MAARCVVCRNELPADPVLCPRCETPHHADCWEYLGGCAIYGCLKRDPVPARPAAVWRPGERARGALFGALLGYVVTGVTFGGFLLLFGGQGMAAPAHLALGAAAVCGALAGASVRDADESGRMLLWGTAGPGFGAWLSMIGAVLSEGRIPSPFMVCLSFGLFFFAGLLMCPLALPCVYTVGVFNDPRNAERVERWLSRAFAASVVVSAMLLPAAR